jgi:hypothetical protein
MGAATPLKIPDNPHSSERGFPGTQVERLGAIRLSLAAMTGGGRMASHVSPSPSKGEGFAPWTCEGHGMALRSIPRDAPPQRPEQVFGREGEGDPQWPHFTFGIIPAKAGTQVRFCNRSLSVESPARDACPFSPATLRNRHTPVLVNETLSAGAAAKRISSLQRT